jgi:hypothetical protein
VPGNPLLPQGLLTFDGSRRPFAVEVEANRQIDLATDGEGEKMGDAGSGLVQLEKELISVPAFTRLFNQSS